MDMTFLQNMKRKPHFGRRLFGTAVLLSFLIVLTGCGASTSTDSGSSTDTGSEEAFLSEESDAAEEEGDADRATADAAAEPGGDPSPDNEGVDADSDAVSGKEGELTETAEPADYDYGTPLEVPEGQYLSELTGLPIDQTLQNQRPIAVMVDNESKALPHYGTAEADIVYEMMNSTANDRITRLMCVYKDWGSLTQVGSIRSVRPTNILVAQEYDAVICHDGGPYYINDYFSRYPYHFSGTFSRVNNGKAREFTEYILSGDLERNFRSSGYSTEYAEDSDAPGGHFSFAAYGTRINPDDYDADGVRTANTIELPFYHNGSQLRYNEKTGTYDYYEYGRQHLDADTDAPLTFKNVLLQDCSFHQYDSNGYMIYNCIARFQLAYYCTEGKNISVLWTKEGEDGITRFYDAAGDEITLNPGKTYIGIIPDDTWDEVKIY